MERVHGIRKPSHVLIVWSSERGQSSIDSVNCGVQTSCHQIVVAIRCKWLKQYQGNNEYLLRSHSYVHTIETRVHTIETRVHSVETHGQTLDEVHQLLMVVGGHLSIMDWW